MLLPLSELDRLAKTFILWNVDIPSCFSADDNDLFALDSTEDLVSKMPHRELHSELLNMLDDMPQEIQ